MTGMPRDHVLLYDRDCGFCKWSLDKILAWDRGGRLRPVPIQGEEGERLLAAVDRETRLDSWHLVTPARQVLSAGAAAEPLARLLPGGRPLAFVFRSFPGITDRVYRWVAGHRDRWARLLRVDAGYELKRRWRP
jgi:predicted DCC family thiol-disulfide oxidoreductase YuxK